MFSWMRRAAIQVADRVQGRQWERAKALMEAREATREGLRKAVVQAIAMLDEPRLVRLLRAQEEAMEQRALQERLAREAFLKQAVANRQSLRNSM